MKNSPNKQQQRTVEGLYYRYNITRKAVTDGRLWLQVSQLDRKGELQQCVIFEPELIDAVSEAIREFGGSPPQPRPSHGNRETPTICNLLWDRHGCKRWGIGEECLLVHLFLEGFTPDEIAVRVGRTPVAVTKRIRNLGIYTDMFVDGSEADRWTL